MAKMTNEEVFDVLDAIDISDEEKEHMIMMGGLVVILKAVKECGSIKPSKIVSYIYKYFNGEIEMEDVQQRFCELWVELLDSPLIEDNGSISQIGLDLLQSHDQVLNITPTTQH